MDRRWDSGNHQFSGSSRLFFKQISNQFGKELTLLPFHKSPKEICMLWWFPITYLSRSWMKCMSVLSWGDHFGKTFLFREGDFNYPNWKNIFFCFMGIGLHPSLSTNLHPKLRIAIPFRVRIDLKLATLYNYLLVTMCNYIQPHIPIYNHMTP